MLRYGFALVVVALTSLATALVACSGHVADSSVGTPSAMDGAVDGTVGSEAGSDAGMGMGVDSSISEPDVGTGGDDAATTCAQAASRADCVKCCDMDYPDGAVAYEQDIDECACAADLCGPLQGAGDGGGAEGGQVADAGEAGAAEAGAPESEGGLGTGACAMTCSGGKMADTACNTCRDETLKADGGACSASLKSSCGGDPSCKMYTKCLASCPKK
jgi:hypothetical protein